MVLSIAQRVHDSQVVTAPAVAFRVHQTCTLLDSQHCRLLPFPSTPTTDGS